MNTRIPSALLASHSAQAASGTWTGTTSGNWSDTTKWSGGIIANGAGSTAGFSNLGTVTVTLNSARTIAGLSMNNVGTANWTIANAGFALTFDNGASNAFIANGDNAIAPLTVDTDLVLLSNLVISANGNNNAATPLAQRSVVTPSPAQRTSRCKVLVKCAIYMATYKK